MSKKIIHLLFILCLTKLYYIADQSLQFSPNLLANSFSSHVNEKSSLGVTSSDVIPMKNFFIKRKIKEFDVSNEIKDNFPEIFFLRILEYNYPIKYKKNSTIVVKLINENLKKNCKILFTTYNFNINECK